MPRLMGDQVHDGRVPISRVAMLALMCFEAVCVQAILGFEEATTNDVFEATDCSGEQCAIAWVAGAGMQIQA